ncbi:PREDICTED: uncharacterized protein LOC103341387 isoform X1 [Prunus mume]|uniref:Uncharacterized protein LOC103341387 isoform X1 n=1 Tax=Prunus mume TaxID=102107 RepID=A0ABM0PQW0_PRUMU|nr:PREDICTED: uncharacterized protein LOC103341387 isoform X1 [Prunus mume]
MGQTLKKLAPGTEENQIKEIRPIIEKCYETHFAGTFEEPTLTDFYRAICETVEEINKQLGNTQFCLPTESKLRQAYEENFPVRMPNVNQMGLYFRMGMKNHHQGKGRSLTREEFQRIFQDVILGTGFTGVGGAKDTLIYIFGVPLTALFVKQRLMPRVIPNEIFIPCVTSATVFVLAKLNKI